MAGSVGDLKNGTGNYIADYGASLRWNEVWIKQHKSKTFGRRRKCRVCRGKLSEYNQNDQCFRHNALGIDQARQLIQHIKESYNGSREDLPENT